MRPFDEKRGVRFASINSMENQNKKPRRTRSSPKNPNSEGARQRPSDTGGNTLGGYAIKHGGSEAATPAHREILERKAAGEDRPNGRD
jgi:hypothetical protein